MRPAGQWTRVCVALGSLHAPDLHHSGSRTSAGCSIKCIGESCGDRNSGRRNAVTCMLWNNSAMRTSRQQIAEAQRTRGIPVTSGGKQTRHCAWTVAGNSECSDCADWVIPGRRAGCGCQRVLPPLPSTGSQATLIPPRAPSAPSFAERVRGRHLERISPGSWHRWRMTFALGEMLY